MHSTFARNLCLAIAFLPCAASASEIDLSTLPEGYAFTSNAPDGDTIVTYLGQDGDLFKFTFDSPDTREEGYVGIVWTNRESQTVKYEGQDGLTLFDPHDCAPGTGTCEYTVTLPDGEVYHFLRSAFRLGKVEIGREYLIDENGGEIFYSQSCTTFDEWGFWVDGIRYDFDGVFEWDKRAQSTHEPGTLPSYDAIRKLCDFSPDLPL